LKIKALILTIVFLFSGLGFSIDVATCCNQISGLSFSFVHSIDSKEDNCASCTTSSFSCCDYYSIETVINTNVFNNSKFDFKSFIKSFSVNHQSFSFVEYKNLDVLKFSQSEIVFPSIPVLLKKRVLQI